MSWLLQFCAARAAFATMFTAWSAVLPLLRNDWQLSAWQAGMVQSGYHIGFLVSLFSVGFLSDRFGARRIYLATGLAAVASGLLFAFFADGFVSALLLYGLTGLCSGGSYTPGLAIVAQRMPERRGLALGFYLAAASLGYAIGLLIASAMIPLAGWRGGFVATALCPLLGLALGWWALRDVPNVVHALPDGHGTRSRIGEVLKNKPAMLSIWGYTFHAWELLGLWAWLPAFLAAASAAGGSGGHAGGQPGRHADRADLPGGGGRQRAWRLALRSPRPHRGDAGHGPGQPGLLVQLWLDDGRADVPAGGRCGVLQRHRRRRLLDSLDDADRTHRPALPRRGLLAALAARLRRRRDFALGIWPGAGLGPCRRITRARDLGPGLVDAGHRRPARPGGGLAPARMPEAAKLAVDGASFGDSRGGFVYHSDWFQPRSLG
jgi:hypothetical protein